MRRLEKGEGVVVGCIHLDGPHLPIPDVVVDWCEEDVFHVFMSGVVFQTVAGLTREKVPILVRSGFQSNLGLKLGSLAGMRQNGSHGWVGLDVRYVCTEVVVFVQTRFISYVSMFFKLFLVEVFW